MHNCSEFTFQNDSSIICAFKKVIRIMVFIQLYLEISRNGRSQVQLLHEMTGMREHLLQGWAERLQIMSINIDRKKRIKFRNINLPSIHVTRMRTIYSSFLNYALHE